LTGLLYVLSGFFTRHFWEEPGAGKTDLGWKIDPAGGSRIICIEAPAGGESRSYNVLQRLTYLAVVFLLFPLIIITGLAMSPAITSVFPVIVTVFGGQQSARTIHFFVAVALVLFLLRPHRDVGVPGGIQESHAGHDHRPQHCREGAIMSSPLSRRKLITTGLATAAGVSGLGARCRHCRALWFVRPTMAASLAQAKH